MILSVCPNPSVDTLIHVEKFVPGEVHRPIREERFPGGKGVHVALAAAELGEKVTLLGFWGGETGRWLQRECSAKKVKCVGPLIKEDSRTCITLLTPGIHDQTEILGLGPMVTHRDLSAFADTFAKLLKSASVITMSGSWPHGAPPTAYADLLENIKLQNAPVILDTTGQLLSKALALKFFAVHLNRAESRTAFKTSDPQKAAHLLARHCQIATVTAGADGAYFVIDGITYHGICPIKPKYSSVGSGDCFVAGLAVALHRKLNAEDIVALACACGTANCLNPDLGMLKRKDVLRLIQQTTVKRLK